MSRKKKKKSGSKVAATSWDALAATTLSAAGNAIGQLIADGTERFAAARHAVAGSSNGPATPPPPPVSQIDLAGEILRLLDAAGEKSIAELVHASGGGLTRTLKALHMASEFGLIEVDKGRATVRLTDAGCQTAATLYRSKESRDQREPEESAEAFPE